MGEDAEVTRGDSPIPDPLGSVGLPPCNSPIEVIEGDDRYFVREYKRNPSEATVFSTHDRRMTAMRAASNKLTEDHHPCTLRWDTHDSVGEIYWNEHFEELRVVRARHVLPSESPNISQDRWNRWLRTNIQLSREPAVWSWNSSLFDLVVDPAHMLAAALGSPLLPVWTGTRLADDIDVVAVPGRGRYLVPAAFREQRDVHRFVDSASGSWLESILLCRLLGNDHPIADIASLPTVRSDGTVSVLKTLLQKLFDRMIVRPEIMDFTPLTMVVGPTDGSIPVPDAPCTEGGHYIDDDSGDHCAVVWVEQPKSRTLLPW